MVYRNYNRISKGNSFKIFLTVMISSIIGIGGFSYITNPSTPTNTQSPITYSDINHQTFESSSYQTPSQSKQSSSIQSATQPPIDAPSIEHTIHDMVNNLRKQNDLNTLVYDEKLAIISREHSKDMAINNYYDHTSPNGVGLQDRYRNANFVCYNWMGENIQQQNIPNNDLANIAFQTWINSPEHRDNILNKNFMKEGIGLYISSNTIFITEDFC